MPSGPYLHMSTFVFLSSPFKRNSVFSSQEYERSAFWFSAAACLAAASFCLRSCAWIGGPATYATATECDSNHDALHHQPFR